MRVGLGQPSQQQTLHPPPAELQRSLENWDPEWKPRELARPKKNEGSKSHNYQENEILLPLTTALGS